MKRTIWIGLLVFFLASCGQHPKHWDTLTRVEALMEERPDSALTILQGIDTTDLLSIKDKALYSLLYTQAEDKNHIDATDDSRILIAVNHYKNSKDKFHNMKSHYYWGRILYNAQSYSKAVVSMMKAEEMAKILNDNFQLGLIYRNCSDIYNSIYNNVESRNYAERSYEHFKLTGCEQYIRWALWQVGSTYHNCKDYERSIDTMKEVIEIAEETNDESLLVEALRLLGMSSLANKQYNESIDAFLKISELNPNLMSIEDYRNLGLAYIGIGNLRKGQEYEKIVSAMDITDQWLSYEINKRNGNYKVALAALENEHTYQDDVLGKSLNQTVTNAVEDYYKSEREIQIEESRYEKRILSLLMVIVVLIMIFIVVWVSLYSLQKRKERDRNMMLVYSLKENLAVKEEEVGQLFKKQFETIDKLCHTYYESHNTYDEKTKIYTKVMTIIANLRSDKQTIAELEIYANTYHNNLIHKFHEANASVAKSDNDNLLFLYIVVGFSSRAISVLFDEGLSVIYNRKARLKKRIQDSDCEYKNEFLAHFT